MSGAEPRVVAMYLPVGRGESRSIAITRERWQAITRPYPPMIRGRVANLAAHNWTVFAVDGAILVTSPWGDGCIFFKDGQSRPFRPEHNDVLFPRAADQRCPSYGCVTRARRSDGVIVDGLPSDDGLWSLVHAGVFASTPAPALESEARP